MHRVLEAVLVVVDREQHVGFIDDADDLAVRDHGKLGDIVELHARVRREQGVRGGQGVVLVLAVAAGDQVAQIAVGLAFDEALVDHPEVVVHLREVLVAAVGDEGDDAFRAGLPAAVLERRADQRSRRRADDQAFRAQHLAGHGEGLGVGHHEGVADQRKVAIGRDEVLADALDQPRADIVAQLAGLDHAGENRAFGVGQHHLDVGRDPFHEAADAGQRAARADAADHGVEVVVHLLPDLGAGGGLVDLGVGRVGELVDEEGADLAGDPLGEVLVVLGMALADVRAGHAHLGAQRLEVEDLFLAHLVGHDDDQAVALLSGDQGEAEAGVAGGRLDDGAAGLEHAVVLGRLDHRQADAVLDRAARVLQLELGEQPAGPGIELGEFDHRRVADHFEDVAGNHRGTNHHGTPAESRAGAAA